eukprot:6172599-Pleurochrysis_carterae.AAC.4
MPTWSIRQELHALRVMTGCSSLGDESRTSKYRLARTPRYYRRFCPLGSIWDDSKRHAKLVEDVAAGTLAHMLLRTTLLMLPLVPGWPEISLRLIKVVSSAHASDRRGTTAGMTRPWGFPVGTILVMAAILYLIYIIYNLDDRPVCHTMGSELVFAWVIRPTYTVARGYTFPRGIESRSTDGQFTPTQDQ